MKRCVNFIANKCLEHGLVTAENVPWLKYAIEKRISMLLGFLPCCIISICLADIWVTVTFLGSFYLLRSRCNGFHAKTFLGCIIISFSLELFFLLVIYPLLTPLISGIVFVVSACLLLILAPFDHPNMHYTQAELAALKKSVKVRMAGLAITFAVLEVLQLWKPANGLTIGIAMTALLLCLAYISGKE